MHSVSPKFTKESVFLDCGAWRLVVRQVFPHQDSETTVALGNAPSSLSLLFPHFWAESWPQEVECEWGQQEEVGRGAVTAEKATRSTLIAE